MQQDFQERKRKSSTLKASPLSFYNQPAPVTHGMAAHSLKALFLKPQGKVFLASNPLAVRVAPFHIGRIHILISHAESSGGIHCTAVFKECSHGVHVLAVFFGRASYALRVRKPRCLSRCPLGIVTVKGISFILRQMP